MNKKPTRLKVLQGNPGKRPLPENEPEPKAVMPKMLKEMDKDARKTWKALGPTLVKLGLLCETDGISFGLLCQLRSRLKKCIEKVNGLNELIDENVFTDEKGEDFIRCRTAAYVTVEEKYYKLFRTYASDFGLTPRGRVGLGVNITGKKKSPLAGLVD